MTIKKFLTSVADVMAYDENDNIVFTGMTLLDSSIEASLGSTPIRGGRGNQLQYIYYHTGELKFTLTDTQWNLQMLGATVGSDVMTGGQAYKQSTVTLTSASAGNMPADITPLSFTGTGTVYGWAKTSDNRSTYRVLFTSGTPYTFETVNGETLGTTGESVCVRYYVDTPEAQYIEIKANMIPKVVRLVMETQLNSGDVSSNKIGVAQIIAPTVTLSGNFSISMKADGAANTPLTGTALSYNGPIGSDACANEPYYARIIEILDAANWYDNVLALAFQSGDTTMDVSSSLAMVVWAVPYSGPAFKAPTSASALTFAVSGSPTALGTTITPNTGIVTSGSTVGEAVITVNITAVPTIDATATITVE